jgi:CRISPR system Cascade subunit CasA
MKSFDLTVEKWIPCITLTREYNCYSLRDVFAEAHTLREVHGDTPLVTVALYRLLLAVLHSVPRYKCRESSDWLTLWQLGKFDTDAICHYLDQQSERFNLFHEQYPFGQDIGTAHGQPFKKSLAEVMHEVSAGNNAAWFDHTLETDGFERDAATAARIVLSARSFGLTGRDSSGGYQSFGPLVNDVIFVVQGDNLFETLMLNLYLYQDRDPLPEKDDRPIWEHDAPLEPRTGLTLAQSGGGSQHPGGYLDLLTWPSRRILLKRDDDGMVRWLKMDQGWVLHADDAVKDPMKAYKTQKQAAGKGRKKSETPGKVALQWDENRALWRDSTALFRLRTEFSGDRVGTYQAPGIIHNLHRLLNAGRHVIPQGKMYRCAAFGMSASRASVQFFRSEFLPLPLAYLTDEGKPLVDKLDDLLQITERAGARLVQAVRVMVDCWLEPNDETRKKDVAAKIVQHDLEDLDALRAAFGEDAEADIEFKQSQRDDKLPQRKGLRSIAERRYWATIGEHFYQEMMVLAEKSPDDKEGIDALVAKWQHQVWRIAWESFEETAQSLGDSPRALKAYARGAETLEGRYFIP